MELSPEQQKAWDALQQEQKSLDEHLRAARDPHVVRLAACGCLACEVVFGVASAAAAAAAAAALNIHHPATIHTPTHPLNP
jgi:hypothetical protein